MTRNFVKISDNTLTEPSAQADVALLWLRPAVYQRPEHDYADIALSPLTGVDVAKAKQIEAAKPTALVINSLPANRPGS